MCVCPTVSSTLCVWLCVAARMVSLTPLCCMMVMKCDATRSYAPILQRHRASLVLTRCVRRVASNLYHAAVTIQCAWHCHVARCRLIARRHAAAAVRLQSMARCRLARRQLAALRERDAGARLMQCWWRAIAQRRRQCSAATVQRCWRCWRARQELHHRRAAAASTRISMALRRRALGARVRQRVRRRAAVVVQCWVRTVVARWRVQAMRSRRLRACSLGALSITTITAFSSHALHVSVP